MHASVVFGKSKASIERASERNNNLFFTLRPKDKPASYAIVCADMRYNNNFPIVENIFAIILILILIIIKINNHNESFFADYINLTIRRCNSSLHGVLHQSK